MGGDALSSFIHAQEQNQRRLFTLSYGTQPHQIPIVPHKVQDDTDYEGELLLALPPVGGPTDFRVSWDGQLFYLVDPMVLREGEDGEDYEDWYTS